MIGVVGARLAGTTLESLLFGVTPGDPVTYVGTAVILAAVALFAGWLPAFRASRMDPVNALRVEG